MRYQLTALVAATFACSLVSAAEMGGPSSRSNSWEFGLIVNHLDSWDTSGRSGSNIDVSSDTGWGFSFGYNYNEHFNLGFEFVHNEQSYDASIVPDNPPGLPREINHKLTNDSYNFNFTYNFLAQTFTPFVAGGLGWSYLDSNVRSSEINTGCWWDPWWGYICADYYSTYSDTAFSYSVGAGLRWEAINNFVLKASINQRWVDLDRVADTPEMKFGKLEFVWTM